jgi:two-component system, NtrC family, sensor kinase
MKSFYFILLLFLLGCYDTVAQTPSDVDSVARLLSKTKEDTSRVFLLVNLASNYTSYKPDSARFFSRQALNLAQKLRYKKGECRALNEIGSEFRNLGEYPQALETHFKALQISKGSIPLEEGGTSMNIGNLYKEVGDYSQALSYLNHAKNLLTSVSSKLGVSSTLSTIGETYEKMNKLDSALFYQEQAYAFAQSNHLNVLAPLRRLGSVYAAMGNYQKALSYYNKVLNDPSYKNSFNVKALVPYKIADAYFQIKQVDSSIYYAKRAFKNSEEISYKRGELDASSLLAKIYKSKNKLDSAYYYQDISMSMRDSLFGIDKFQRLQLLAINEQQRQQKIMQQQERYKNKIRLYVSLAAIAVFLFVAIILFRNNRAKQKANALLQSQKVEIQKALNELKATQTQLIQSEKMASLGELTAGIAHEIQNPLNFVNNFSEVSKELVDEMEGALQKDNKEEAVAIASDIKDNLQKIHAHGKRADAIVKGMLQHSRASTGKKEPIDINALADEYLRLSYHGLRAKDKDFSVNLKTDFDESIGKIEVAPQDIGRVLLNLYNNAFYSVNEKKKQLNGTFEPTVEVTTRRHNSMIEISVKDNGIGIPQKTVDKIYQPFFTTKPTGQGTGLGLSLSYDIITKGHGGQLTVDAKEGEYAKFVVQLPRSSITTAL